MSLTVVCHSSIICALVPATGSWTISCLVARLPPYLSSLDCRQDGVSNAEDVLDNRVPIGSPFLLMRTQALSSNLIRPPSFLCCSFLALTTTACRMSPRRTLLAIPKLEPPGLSGPEDLCFCTTTIILSPEDGNVSARLLEGH